jgi:tetratricopeptide (TPR) repeat protein
MPGAMRLLAPRACAARWFTAALRLLPQDRRTLPRRLELLICAADALVAAGHLERGLDALLEALALVPPASGAMRVRLIGACAGCENLLGRHDAAHARLLRALAELDGQSAIDAAALRVELAADAIFDSDFVAMLDRAEQARATAREHRQAGLTAVATALVCFAAYTLGRLQPAEDARVQAATALDSMSDDALAGRLDATYHLGYAEYFCERCDDAIRHLERGIAVARASEQGQFLVPTMVALAFSLEVRGRLRAQRTRARDRRPRRAGPHQSQHRGAAVRLGQDRREPSHERLRKAARRLARRGRRAHRPRASGHVVTPRRRVTPRSRLQSAPS